MAARAGEHAAEFQQAEQLAEAFLTSVQAIGRRQLHVVEHERGERQHRLADLVDGVRAHTLEVARQQPERHGRVLPRRLAVAVDGRHHDIRGVLAVVHVGLAPVQDEVLVHRARVRLHVHGVRARLRLRDGQREQQPARLAVVLQHVGELAFVGELPHDGEVEQVVLKRQRGAGAPRQLLDDERLRAQAERAVTVLQLFEPEVQIHEPLRHLVGKTLVATPLVHVLGGERLLAEGAERLHELALLVSQFEIHVVPSFLRNAPAPACVPADPAALQSGITCYQYTETALPHHPQIGRINQKHGRNRRFAPTLPGIWPTNR